MTRTGQRGNALFAVTLMLVLVGAMALAMSREGAMAAQSVEAEYGTAAARALAEAGLNLAKWRNQRSGCKSHQDLALTTLPGIGSFSATVAKSSSRTLDIVALGTTGSGARVTVARDNVVTHDPSDSINTTVSTWGARSSYISAAAPDTALAAAAFIELSRGSSSALLRFWMGDIPADASITSAQLSLTQYQASASAGNVSVYRVLSDWNESAVTWNRASTGTAWNRPGADFAGGSAATVMVAANGRYSWDVTTLVDGWARNLYPNYGFLLTPDGPVQQARYYEFGAGGGLAPSLAVTYIPAC